MRLIIFLFSIFLSLFLFACAKPVPDQPSFPVPAPPGALHLEEAIDRLAAELVETSGGQQIGRVAVADLVGPGRRITALGEYMSDKLSVRLFASQRFPDMMERRLLKEVLAARKQEMTGYFDQSSVQEFGALLGVDSMVVGSIQELGGAFDVTVRVVEAGTGRLQAMADVKVRRDGAVEELLTRPRSATLTIQVDPAVSGTVSLPGKTAELLHGVAVIKDVPFGPTTVTVMAQGFETARTDVDVRSPEQSSGLRLTPRRLSASFQLLPPHAELSVNGAPIQLNAQGFAEVADLLAGQNSYHARAEGFDPVVDVFDPLQTPSVTVRLTPLDDFSSTQNKLYEKIQTLRHRQDFKVRLWTDKTDYVVGDTIRFHFQAERDCYLNLVNIASNGEMRLIFPNAFQQDSFIRGGVVHSIPAEGAAFEFQIQPPIGSDRIYAIASDRPLNIFKTDFKDQAFAVFTRSAATDREMRAIGVRLDQTTLSAADEYVIRIR